jgi:hypothetical protein
MMTEENNGRSLNKFRERDIDTRVTWWFRGNEVQSHVDDKDAVNDNDEIISNDAGISMESLK